MLIVFEIKIVNRPGTWLTHRLPDPDRALTDLVDLGTYELSLRISLKNSSHLDGFCEKTQSKLQP